MHPELHALIVEAAAASVVPTPPTSFAPDIEEEANLYFQKVGCDVVLAYGSYCFVNISDSTSNALFINHLGASAARYVKMRHPWLKCCIRAIIYSWHRLCRLKIFSPVLVLKHEASHPRPPALKTEAP